MLKGIDNEKIGRCGNSITLSVSELLPLHHTFGLAGHYLEQIESCLCLIEIKGFQNGEKG